MCALKGLHYNGIVIKRFLFLFVLVLICSLTWADGHARTFYEESMSRPIHRDTGALLPPSNLSNMRVRAFPLYSIAPMEGKQTVFILVQDKIFNPIPNAEITLIVQIPGKGEHGFIVQERTNQEGFTQYTFPYSCAEVGNVVITVSAKLGNMNAQTTSSFMIWW